jgi:hypothetical protein
MKIVKLQWLFILLKGAKLLLDELSKNITIEVIAQLHKRTIGGINARRREIAYKMHSNNISMEEIISKTPETRSLQILENYEGSNNYILNLKHKKRIFLVIFNYFLLIP